MGRVRPHMECLIRGSIRHLGTLRGSGTLECAGEALGRAEYEFDGYRVRPGEISASGEVRMAPPQLAGEFGRKDLSLRTDDGHLLSVRFSAKWLPETADVAHADVYAGLPAEKNWRR